MPLSNLSKLTRIGRDGIRNFTVRHGASVQDCTKELIRQGKLLLGNSNLLQPDSTLPHLNGFLRHGSVYSGRLDSVNNQGKNLTVLGTVSRTFSIPSVSGPAYQICEYHINHLFSESKEPLFSAVKPEITMATFGTFSVFSDRIVDIWSSKCYNRVSKIRKSVASVICIERFDGCIAARMSLKNKENSNHPAFFGYFIYNALKSRNTSDLNSWSETKGFYHSASTSQSAGTASDLSFDNTTQVDQETKSNTSSDQQIPMERTLKLLSGSCYLPHPDKEETGGEDAHFICAEEQAIGVADGVGGWADVGINAGLYAQELMANSVNAIREEPKGCIDPIRVLEKAHSSTKVRGSSTACIIALTNEGLHAINLGDSGFIVIRDGCTVFRSPSQQHDFNLTYQLECGTGGDLPSAGQVFTVPVAPGDVVIAGTDGLFDNLYNNEVIAVVVHSKRARLGPQVTAQKIASLARQRAQDRNRQTPFSTAAQDAGFRYYGGKLDDITVVVSYITSSCNEKESSS
ncbi:hypothetical protein V2J09_011729 [Rumex salicifolius]